MVTAPILTSNLSKTLTLNVVFVLKGFTGRCFTHKDIVGFAGPKRLMLKTNADVHRLAGSLLDYDPTIGFKAFNGFISGANKHEFFVFLSKLNDGVKGWSWRDIVEVKIDYVCVYCQKSFEP